MIPCMKENRAARHSEGVSLRQPRQTVVARAGAPKPDISSVDALKHTLLTVRSIVLCGSREGRRKRCLMWFSFERDTDHISRKHAITG
jgi:hypothetical protein